MGFLWENANTFPDALEAFRQELRRLGYIEGGNLRIEFRWAEGDTRRMRELAEELVLLNVDVIVTPSSVYTAAAKQATSTIPIVFMSHADPLRTGHVASLARPGGNVTGFSGLFVLRLKLPKGYAIPPHTHPKPEIVTVISGTFMLGMGNVADKGNAKPLPAGSFFAFAPGMAHYAFTDEETVVQINSSGPWGINYVNPKDDPRQ